MQKRMHSREFKLDVVRQIASGQKRPAQAAANMVLLTACCRAGAESIRSVEKRRSASQSGEATTQEQRIAELERFCGQLALENRVLKKALQSRGSRSGTP